jgi:transcriptional regulator with XRE-family HTH domain
MFHEHIRQRVQKLGIKNGEFAALVGVSAPAFSNFLKGRKEIPDAKRLDAVLQDLEDLKTYFPIPLGLHDAKLLAVALERFRAGKFNSFRRLTQVVSASFKIREEVTYLRRHYPKLWKHKEST